MIKKDEDDEEEMKYWIKICKDMNVIWPVSSSTEHELTKRSHYN